MWIVAKYKLKELETLKESFSWKRVFGGSEGLKNRELFDRKINDGNVIEVLIIPLIPYFMRLFKF